VSNILVGLPLKLIDFTANYQQPDALLQWTTSEEINTKKFEIERGTDPFHFVPVGSVAARGGNSTGHVKYQFRDVLSAIAGNKFYYRLKMTDQDKKYQYSGIKLVAKEDKLRNEVVIMPNPVKGPLGYVCVNFEREAMSEISIVDMQGHIKIIGRQKINKGVTIVPIITDGLNNGSYILQVRAEGVLMTSKFILTM
jgi:hypothetical protein